MSRALLAVVLLVGVGCGGGATFSEHVYRDAEANYRVGTLGPTWERIGIGDNDLAWHDGRGSVIQINATCDPFQDVPLSALTNHLLIGFTEREWRSSETVPLDAREALRSHVVAKLDGVPRELLLYVLKKNQCTYDFALVAPPGEPYRAAEADFERLVAGFSTELSSP